jgi:nicotinamidase-related amidase
MPRRSGGFSDWRFTMKRHETILRRDDSLLVVVDYQQRLVEHLAHGAEVTAEIVRLVKGMQLLGVPVIATEQYPKGLGPTAPAVAEVLDPQQIEEKLTFSCCGIDPFAARLAQHQRRQIILVGIETHVCILQTALDLLANDYQVHLPFNATGSRCDANRDNALQRMQQAGVIITNTESLLFELLGQAGTDEFKQVRTLIV